MLKNTVSILARVVILVNLTIAQGEAAVPFLVPQQSPQFTGAAQVGVAVPPIDPMGFYLNPALLGETSKEFNFTTLFLPSKATWLGWTQAKFNTWGFSLGYNFENMMGLPLSIGFGFIKNKFDYGTFHVTSSDSPTPLFTTESYDQFNSFSFGVGYEYYIKISAGLSLKNFTSDFGDRLIDGVRRNLKAEGTAIDYGFLFTAPISDLFHNNLKILLKQNWFVEPKTSFSLGYSVTNIGDEIEYTYLINQKDPIPRTARLGYNINLGFDVVKDDFKFNLLDYYFIVEAEDILVNKKTEENHETSYQSGLGDIQFGKQLINLEGDDNVVLRKAHMFRFLESVTFSVGRFDGRGYRDVKKTSGYTISTTGLSKYLAANFDNEIIQFIANHFSIEYYNTTLFVDWWETEIEGVGIILKNFSF